MKKPKTKSPALAGAIKAGLTGTDARLRAMRDALAGATRQTVNKSQAAYWLRAEVRMTWVEIGRELGISQPNACGMARRYAQSKKFPWPIELLGDATPIPVGDLAAVESGRRKIAKGLKR